MRRKRSSLPRVVRHDWRLLGGSLQSLRVWTDAHDEMLMTGSNWALIRVDARYSLLRDWTNEELGDKYQAYMEQNPAGVPSPIQEDEVEDVNAQEEGLGAVLAAFDQIGQPPTLLEQTKHTNKLLQKILDKMDILMNLLLGENGEDTS